MQWHILKYCKKHKNKLVAGFTQKYNVDRPVYFEVCSGIVVAIEREKQIKGWLRKKKQELINTLNPKWDDLYRSLDIVPLQGDPSLRSG